jgi:tetratricopeptide (TPR) repeat protein
MKKEKMKNKKGLIRITGIICLLSFVTVVWGQETDAKRQRKFDYFFYEGLNLKNAGKFDAAFNVFNHCLSLDSTSAPLLFELSTFYMLLDHTDMSVDYLKRAVTYSADNFTYKMALATILRNLGRFGEAVEVYEELVKKYPDKVELNYYLADALTQATEYMKAIDAYNSLESNMGMIEGISMQKYRLYNTLEKPDLARQEIEKLAAKFPLEARYSLIIGDLYLEDGETDKAYESYQKAYSIDPSNPYYIVSMTNYYEAIHDREAAEAQIRNALANEKLDIEVKVGILSRYILRLEQSQTGTDNVVELFESLIEQHPEETELRMMYGRFQVMKGKTEEARFQFQLITEMEPENMEAWQQLLDLVLKAQDTAEVIRLCEKCIVLFPDSPEYYFYLSIGYYQDKEYDKSIDACRTGIEVVPPENKPLRSTFYGQIGDILHQADKQEEAFEAYEKALENNDKNVLVLNNYAYFLSLENRDLKKAERMSAQCIKLEPNNATYIDTYAWIFFKQGDYTLAKFYIESALNKDDTQSAELVDHYGDILFMTGDKEKAVVQWKKAKELGKDTPVLDRKIAEENYIEDADAR